MSDFVDRGVAVRRRVQMAPLGSGVIISPRRHWANLGAGGREAPAYGDADPGRPALEAPHVREGSQPRAPGGEAWEVVNLRRSQSSRDAARRAHSHGAIGYCGCAGPTRHSACVEPPRRRWIARSVVRHAARPQRTCNARGAARGVIAGNSSEAIDATLGAAASSIHAGSGRSQPLRLREAPRKGTTRSTRRCARARRDRQRHGGASAR
jgi:hypothetical protein